MEKVFGIGFPKTATTSLEEALTILGYNVCKGHGFNNYTNFLLALAVHNDVEEIIKFTKQFDAFFDMPWGGMPLYKIACDEYPNAKFILSIRDPEKWYTSFEEFFLQFSNDLKTCMDVAYKKQRYGIVKFTQHVFGIENLVGTKDKVISIYKEYNEHAQIYLKERNRDLLVIDVTENNGWEALCTFLDKPIPAQDFPHRNPTVKTLTLGKALEVSSDMVAKGKYEEARQMCTYILEQVPDNQQARHLMSEIARKTGSN